jgi:hypothetical protein
MLGFEFVEKFLYGLSVAGFVEAARCLGGQFLSGTYLLAGYLIPGRIADPSAASMAGYHRNHPAFFQSERSATPLDLIHAEAGQPDKKRKQIAHWQQPEVAPQNRIAQSPNAHYPGHREPQNEICADVGCCNGG